MKFTKGFVCIDCESWFSASEKILRCKKCGGSLDIVYDYSKIREVLLKESFLREPVRHWKYWYFYPVLNPSKKVSLQEGGSPLIESKFLSDSKRKVWLKYEGMNPTGSFKDRGTTVEVTKAVEFGVEKVCCASTGNMGASVAAYCGRAGISCHIFLPVNTSSSKIYQIKIYGAKITKVKGTYADALKACLEYAKKTGSYVMGDYPYRGEGEKSVGFEIADQLNWQVPDYVIVPMGNGTLIYAVWDAFNDLKRVGLVKKLPKMVGIQAKGCSPIVDAFKRKRGIKPVEKPKTIASAIACGDPLDGQKALKAILDSGGLAETVSDDDMIQTIKAVARNEGLYVESAGAASVAGFLKLKGKLKETVVCVLTGNGLKEGKL